MGFFDIFKKQTLEERMDKYERDLEYESKKRLQEIERREIEDRENARVQMRYKVREMTDKQLIQGYKSYKKTEHNWLDEGYYLDIISEFKKEAEFRGLKL